MAKGWLHSSLTLWDRLQDAPSNSLLGIAARESIRLAHNHTQKNVAWAGRFMSMLHMITGRGTRDEASTVQAFVLRYGYDALTDCILPVPSGVVWTAWEKFIATEPWEGLGTEPWEGTADTSVVRLATYNGWFAVP